MLHASTTNLAGVLRFILLGTAFTLLFMVIHGAAHANGAAYSASYEALPGNARVTVRGLFVESGYRDEETARNAARAACMEWLDDARDRPSFGSVIPCTLVPGSDFGHTEANRCGIVNYGASPAASSGSSSTCEDFNNPRPSEMAEDNTGTSFCVAACGPLIELSCSHISYYDFTTESCMRCPDGRFQDPMNPTNPECTACSLDPERCSDNIQSGVSLVARATEPSRDTNTYGLVGLGALGVMGIVLLNHGEGALSFNPHAEVHHVGETYTEYGARLDYTEEDWTGYWSASRGDRGEWRYGTGAKWTGDIFTAGFANTADGEQSDSQFAIGARGEWGVWTLESAYAADWALTETENEWTNRVSAGASAEYFRWTIVPKAEFAWQPDDIGADVRFRLNFLRDL